MPKRKERKEYQRNLEAVDKSDAQLWIWTCYIIIPMTSWKQQGDHRSEERMSGLVVCGGAKDLKARGRRLIDRGLTRREEEKVNRIVM